MTVQLQEIELRALEAMFDGEPWHRADGLADRLRLSYVATTSTLGRLRRLGLVTPRWQGVSDPKWYGLTGLGEAEARRGRALRAV